MATPLLGADCCLDYLSFAYRTTDHLLLLSISSVMSWLRHGVSLTKQGEHEQTSLCRLSNAHFPTFARFLVTIQGNLENRISEECVGIC